MMSAVVTDQAPVPPSSYHRAQVLGTAFLPSQCVDVGPRLAPACAVWKHQIVSERATTESVNEENQFSSWERVLMRASR